MKKEATEQRSGVAEAIVRICKVAKELSEEYRDYDELLRYIYDSEKFDDLSLLIREHRW